LAARMREEKKKRTVMMPVTCKHFHNLDSSDPN
jgi:hypothetical protein